MAHPRQFEPLAEGLLVRAPAKLNLSLLIAGKRPDGFHEIETVMAKIDWYDELRIEPGSCGIDLVCNGPHWAPDGKENLVYRAAEEAFRAAGRAESVRLTLTKNIPAGSGLGGASSDAAATLMGLDRYFNLGLSPHRMARIAGRLGSDVAFFLGDPLALCTGRGEKISPLHTTFKFSALLILPDINVSTAKVYANYTHDDSTYRKWSARINDYLGKNRVDFVAKMCVNMLEASCYRVFPELGQLKETIESLGIGPVCLSGSGSTLYAMLTDSNAGRLDSLGDEIASKTGCRSIVVGNNSW